MFRVLSFNRERQFFTLIGLVEQCPGNQFCIHSLDTKLLASSVV